VHERPLDTKRTRSERGADRARWIVGRLEQLWVQTDRACRERVLLDAIACAERRAATHDDGRAVLCHGDLHELNALRSDDGTFKLVDPKGVVAEREFDLGVIMRNAPGEDDLHERADWLAATTGCDRTAIWEWGTAERVVSGLSCRLIGFQPHGDRQLADAERLCAAWGIEVDASFATWRASPAVRVGRRSTLGSGRAKVAERRGAARLSGRDIPAARLELRTFPFSRRFSARQLCGARTGLRPSRTR
jgi:hypothetical protein